MDKIKKQLKRLRELKRKFFFYLFRYPKYLFPPTPLFKHINIQTNNRCTRRCHYCYYGIVPTAPPLKLMSRDLFEKIINDLVDIGFKGRISFFEINEPLTDQRIFDFLAFAKNKLPDAFYFLITNSDLLTKENGKKLFESGLDELWINCYEEDKVLRNKNISDYLASEGYKTKIIRNYKAQEWDSKGGSIKKYYKGRKKAPCELVFNQIIIQPDGNVNACVNDFFGKNNIGNVYNNSLKEIWFGEKFEKLRRSLIKSNRSVNELCAICDYKGYGGFVDKFKK